MSQELNEAERELAKWCTTRVGMTPDGLTKLIWMTAWQASRATVPAAQQAIRMTPELRAELVAWGRSPEGDEDADEALLAVLNAGAAAQQEGWVSVPVEPTEAMIAGAVASGFHATHLEYYRAMIAAAPSAPAKATFSPDWANYRQGVADGAAEAASVRDAAQVKAAHHAVSALHFDDGSDFKFYLIAILKELAPGWLDEMAKDSSEVFHRSREAVCALQGKPEASRDRSPYVLGVKLPESVADQIARLQGKPEAAKGGELTPLEIESLRGKHLYSVQGVIQGHVDFARAIEQHIKGGGNG